MKTQKILPVLLAALIIPISSISHAQENDRISQLEEKVEALGKELEKTADTKQAKTTLGGYGELHYNRLSEDDGGELNMMDFHRFVLFVSHEFTDKIRFVSELELEHSLAGEGKPGEMELEQAYIEFDHSDHASTQGGLFLIPIGIMNETHEPTTFFGVERNDVESIIIPSTWWEAGAQTIQRFGEGWQVNIAAHSGLATPTTGNSAYRVRSGRQKVAEANGSKFAYTARLKYTGIPGLEWALSAQVQDDASQVAGDGLDNGTLLETHIVFEKKGFGLRALYAAWEFDGSAVEIAANNADKQSGWYVEPSYRFTDQFGIFARVSEVVAARAQDNFEQVEIGINWWPHEKVVIKADYRKREHALLSQVGNDFDGFDIGIGYLF